MVRTKVINNIKKNKTSQKSANNPFDVPKYIRFIAYALTTLFSVFTFGPFLLTLSVSLTDNTELALKGYSLIPAKWSIEAYRYLFKNSEQILRSYGVTIMVTVAGTIFGLLIMTMFAYAVSRKDFVWRKQFIFFVFFTMLFSGGLIPTYIVVSNVLHLRDTIFALILPLCSSVMYIMILRTYMSTVIPEEIIESAKLDGAGEFTCYSKIILPMSIPAIATIMLFMTVSYWNAWYQAFLYIIRNNNIIPIQLLLKRIENDLQFLARATDGMSFSELEDLRQNLPTESVKMALVIIVVIPTLISYPFFQQFFIRGITIGAVKG